MKQSVPILPEEVNPSAFSEKVSISTTIYLVQSLSKQCRTARMTILLLHLLAGDLEQNLGVKK
jgi:hypothetical protein